MKQYGLNPEIFEGKERSVEHGKKNCWEFFGCKDYSTCPVPGETRLDGVHGGRNAGRSCWVVAGTMCGGTKQGSHVDKEHGCLQCTFYSLVKGEEFGSPEGFKLSMSLMQMLKGEA